MDIRLSAIHLYPVKSIRGIVTSRAELEPDGLRHDRRWVIVDDQDTETDKTYTYQHDYESSHTTSKYISIINNLTVHTSILVILCSTK